MAHVLERQLGRRPLLGLEPSSALYIDALGCPQSQGILHDECLDSFLGIAKDFRQDLAGVLT
jgi:hypothetical protein